MIEVLEALGFEIVKEDVDYNIVTRRLENDDSVIILEEAFFEPDEVESTIFIIDGELNLDENKFEGLKIIN